MSPSSSSGRPKPTHSVGPFWGFDALGDVTPSDPIPPAPLVCVRHGHVFVPGKPKCVVCDNPLRQAA